MPIFPHGGVLINRLVAAKEKAKILDSVSSLKTLAVNSGVEISLNNIANGAFSPLEGFLREKEFKSVVNQMRLSNGLVWPIPIVLSCSFSQLLELKNELRILLTDLTGVPLAVLENPEFYQYDKEWLVGKVFQTKDKAHPGVAYVYSLADYLIGGEIKFLDNKEKIFPEYNFSPAQAREIFQQNGWNRVVAFQTRNVPHRGHEFLQKMALKEVDGLFIQPVIGEKKNNDFKDEFILEAYQYLVDNFYPKNKTMLGILPLKMRYAGPRSALLHALVRRNYGCSHFIVGRDHAGVGNYYGPYEAQEIFNNFSPREIGIEIMKFPEVAWCKNCLELVFDDTCPHNRENKVYFSGSIIRESLKNQTALPFYVLRPEIANLLGASVNPLVDNAYNKKRNGQTRQAGFTLWFTGLSGSGKSTVADKICQVFKEQGIFCERLDGDVVRESLTRDLSFSKEDRDENIRRVGFVASMLSRNNTAVLASFISPYRAQRDELRGKIENFIEVYCSCPLEACEARDVKGLYKKARAGEIKNFTGVSDVYEAPEHPEITLYTAQETLEESSKKVIEYLEKNNFI